MSAVTGKCYQWKRAEGIVRISRVKVHREFTQEYNDPKHSSTNTSCWRFLYFYFIVIYTFPSLYVLLTIKDPADANIMPQKATNEKSISRTDSGTILAVHYSQACNDTHESTHERTRPIWHMWNQYSAMLYSRKVQLTLLLNWRVNHFYYSFDTWFIIHITIASKTDFSILIQIIFN